MGFNSGLKGLNACTAGLYVDIFQWSHVSHYTKIVLCGGRQDNDYWYLSLLLVGFHICSLTVWNGTCCLEAFWPHCT